MEELSSGTGGLRAEASRRQELGAAAVASVPLGLLVGSLVFS